MKCSICSIVLNFFTDIVYIIGTSAAVIISVATAFVKQHSVLDIAAALPLSLLAEILTFHVIYPKKRDA